MRIMPPANLPPRSSRAAAAHGRRGQRRRRRICACCFKVITKPDSRAQPESSFLPCRIPTRLAADGMHQCHECERHSCSFMNVEKRTS